MPISYKAHTIVAGAARSQRGQNFIPVVYLAWGTDGQRSTHSLILHERFLTYEEASEFAYAEAKAWVDRHAAKLN